MLFRRHLAAVAHRHVALYLPRVLAGIRVGCQTSADYWPKLKALFLALGARVPVPHQYRQRCYSAAAKTYPIRQTVHAQPQHPT